MKSLKNLFVKSLLVLSVSSAVPAFATDLEKNEDQEGFCQAVGYYADKSCEGVSTVAGKALSLVYESAQEGANLAWPYLTDLAYKTIPAVGQGTYDSACNYVKEFETVKEWDGKTNGYASSAIVLGTAGVSGLVVTTALATMIAIKFTSFAISAAMFVPKMGLYATIAVLKAPFTAPAAVAVGVAGTRVYDYVMAPAASQSCEIAKRTDC